MVRDKLDLQHLRAAQNSLHSLEREVLGSLDVHDDDVEGFARQQVVDRRGLYVNRLWFVVKIRWRLYDGESLRSAGVHPVKQKLDGLESTAGGLVNCSAVGQAVQLNVEV